jgi:hypothetical protein
MASLQQRVDCAIGASKVPQAKVSTEELNILVRDLATAKETAALVRVWDLIEKAAVEEATWCGVNALHNLGKGRIPQGGLSLPALSSKTLAPARRLHKICKGRSVKARNVLASEHLDAAISWLTTQQASGRVVSAEGGKARRMMAKELAKALGVNTKISLALVTKLKQKRLLRKA